MTHEEYILLLQRLSRESEGAVIAQLPALERQAYAVLQAWIDANLDVQNGRLVANATAAAAINNFTDAYVGILTELADYRGAVSNYLKNFTDLRRAVETFQQDQGVPIQRAQLGSVQELVVAEIIDRYTANGLNQGFVQPLRELLFQNVTAGTNKLDALAQLREYISGGKDTTGKLSRYLEQTAQQGVDSYTGAINTRIMQTFQINTMIMSGSLIETSSPQCRFGINELGGVIERSEWPKVRAIAADNSLIEGTTFDNLPFNRLHWGCRHEFTPVVLTKEQREAINQPTNR